MRFKFGFTLIELLMSLVLLVVFLLTTVPSLQILYLRTLQKTTVNDFFHAIYYTRSEAVKRRQKVTMCPSEDFKSCLRAATWHVGWMVFVDANYNHQLDSNEQVLRKRNAISDSLTITSSQYRRRIEFQPMGTAGGSNATFVFCDQNEVIEPKAVILTRLGRPRITDEKSEGKALECA